MSNRLQARQAPVSSWVSSQRFLLILHVQHPALDLGGVGVTVEAAALDSERRRVRFLGMIDRLREYPLLIGYLTDMLISLVNGKKARCGRD